MTKPLIIADVFNRISEPNALDWQPFRPGVDIYPIHEYDGRSSAALLRYEPGAEIPVHTHTGYEYLFVLSGSQSDGHALHRAGSFVVNSPGTSHAIKSDEGCVVLLIWEKPVSFDDASTETENCVDSGLGHSSQRE